MGFVLMEADGVSYMHGTSHLMVLDVAYLIKIILDIKYQLMLMV
jgi:hypothetical protein